VEGTGVGGSKPSLVGRPKPSVDVLGEKVGTVTAVKVAETAGSPEVGNVSVDEALDPVVFLPGLEGDQVHAPLSAVVSGIEPVPFSVPDAWIAVLPREPVEMTAKSLYPSSVYSISAQ